jgi:hypothetical protein
MPAVIPVAGERAPRRARYLIPLATPRRREALAAFALAALLAGCLFAQLTLVLTAACRAVSKLSRWSLWWLAVPAAAGLVGVLAVGPGAALAGFGQVPAAVVAVLGRAAAGSATAAGLGRVLALVAAGAGRQLPVALLIAPGLAAIGGWLEWLHTDEWDLPARRPGLVRWCRQWWTAWWVAAGGVLTRDGACLGTVRASGRPAVVPWPDAAGGVLLTGAAPGAVAGLGRQLAHAAIRLRMPVLVVDLAAEPGLEPALAAACAATGAPFLVFRAGGSGYYEPLRETAPAQAAALAAHLVDWPALPGPARAGCQEYLATGLAVLAAAPLAEPGPPAAVLDELAALLQPGALAARLARVPAWHPARGELASQVAAAHRWLAGAAVPASLVATQLARLRASALGGQLGPAPPAGTTISLASVVRRRAVVLFSLDPAADGPAAAQVANLAVADLAALYRDRLRAPAPPPGLAWVCACERLEPGLARDLAAAGQNTGLVAVLGTTDAETAGRLAGQVRIQVVRRLADPGLAARLAGLAGGLAVPAAPVLAFPGQAEAPGAATLAGGWAGPGRAPGARREPSAAPAGLAWVPEVPAEELCTLDDSEFVMVARRGRRPEVTRARAVSARLPGSTR